MVLKWVLDLLYPPKCVICGKLLQEEETDVCLSCLRELPINPVELAPLEFVEQCVSPFFYRGGVRDSILRFKFGGRQHYADFYARYLCACIRERLPEFDLITWVPISRHRRIERGYDQAQLLAEAVAKQLHVPCLRCLKKIKNNERQSRIQDHAKRRANVKGVFASVQPERFRGKRVLLLDDIVTSGASLSECAFVLRTSGAASVLAATAATARKQNP